MTKRKPVSTIKNVFFDSEQVDDNDLTTEQNYNDSIQSAIINNHIGSGVLPEVLNQKVLFDSLAVVGLLDGTNIQAQNQPTDNDLGNQLEVELSGSAAAGKKVVKVAVIGLDFESNLQYDTFVFKTNEKQITKKHYTQILTILFNDLLGTETQSFNLGGRVIIREAKPFTLSRDPLMVAQDVEPNLFFRDFFITGSMTLSSLLKSALPLYNVDNLQIDTGIKENKILAKNDVSSQIGEKFLATTNNIQKTSLLLSVQNTDPGSATDLTWHGDLVISIYPLQSTVDCPTDIAPNLAIEFSPSNIPLAQVSVNLGTLQDQGFVLDGTPQPIDFVFSNTPVASGHSVVAGNFYALTIKRSGSADKCDILVATGENLIDNSRVTLFTGSTWVDIPEDNLWFRVYTDSAKVSDGQAYESGHGIIIPKTFQDESNITFNYSKDNLSFTNNNLFTAVLSSQTELSEKIEDQRTGNFIESRQKFVPNVQLLNDIDLTNLEESTSPLIIGVVEDKNVKSFDASTSVLTADLHAWSFVKNNITLKIVDDITDGYRYDLDVIALVSNLLKGDLINAKIIPDTTHTGLFYRIASARLCSMMYGDVNGDGIIDINDLELLNELIDSNLNTSPPSDTQITDGYTTLTVVNGYKTVTNPFVNDFGLTFKVVDPITHLVKLTDFDGIIVADPNDPSLASFESDSANFFDSGFIIGNMKLVVTNSATSSNNGAFTVVTAFADSIDPTKSHILTLRKPFYSPDVIKQIMRADIDGDFVITPTDSTLLQNYINKVAPFPSTSSPASKIGTRFNILEIVVDPFVDRADDFSPTTPNRATVLHPQQDIYLADGYLQSHDFKDHPVQFSITKELTWEDYLIAAAGSGRFVPSIFESLSGFTKSDCDTTGITCEKYSDPPEFDPGKNDFFVPNDLILGDGGDLKRPDGGFYKVDFEVGSITLEIPNAVLNEEKTLNIFDYFVAEVNESGLTRLGYPALKFADCSRVQTSAIFNNQVRFSVATQSLSPSISGEDADGYAGVIVDERIGVFLDHGTGLLRLNFNNLYEDPVFQTLSTKIQINVYLKRGGFNNTPITIESDQMVNLITLLDG